jgi:hypothetical protein
MTQLIWGDVGDKTFHAGTDRGVLFPEGRSGVAWNGLTGVNEQPTGGEPWKYYFDGVMYYVSVNTEEFAATIEALTYPDEWAAMDGTSSYGGLSFHQQPRKPFHLSYRTKVGNDVDGLNHGYLIHLIYNAMALPSSRPNKALAATPAPMPFSWNIVARPEAAMGMKPSAHLTIDSRKTNPRLLAQLEATLYGTETTEPRFPRVDELIAIYAGALEIGMDFTTGFWRIFDFESHFDLMGNPETGIFILPPNTRLVGSSVTGIYRMREA